MDINQPFPFRVDSSSASPELEGGFVRFKTMVTPSDVLKFGLIGIPKMFPMTQEPLSEEYVAVHLQSTIAQLEMSGMCLSPIIATHIDDWHGSSDWNRYFAINVHKYPVSRIESIILTYPNATTSNPSLTFTIPAEWITHERGKVNVVATTGTISPVVQGNRGGYPMLSLGSNGYRPSAYRLTYQVGFEQDKLPANVWQLILDMTTYNLLGEVGPLLFPTSGISVGIDGLSQSAQLPGARIFEGRIKQLEAKIKANRDAISSYYGQMMTLEFAGL